MGFCSGHKDDGNKRTKKLQTRELWFPTCANIKDIRNYSEQQNVSPTWLLGQ